ncbi:hypothetical protein TPHA_0A05710 [Tetrapisispora phaffii CBS 4417]|uniref:Integral membrane protein n=1 Tax=Tetrapisispora phaffii (strain ATCC 24235 / CBS 4417 / NBRC 1672 / NRRL Y-8282 / UCD 70-5) TaxID=1071381 RepID=G8BP17_TETPH|nr:hypothetical protein TPHA_0A05710 [Tetrapisispora phaffii CBS 4417]CCE61645.1 hypothetical protein TPHA_0A05710 [Tetrapisispora phaffii CBS 4417]
MVGNFLTSNDMPVGYVTPSFPSLYWPINNSKYNTAYLYDSYTIWLFTVYWSLILNGFFYGVAGALACFTHRKKGGGFWILAIYLVLGGVQGIVLGTIIGYIISATYLSALFSMSTWIPLCCAVAQVLFEVTTSYSLVGNLM